MLVRFDDDPASESMVYLLSGTTSFFSSSCSGSDILSAAGLRPAWTNGLSSDSETLAGKSVIEFFLLARLHLGRVEKVFVAAIVRCDFVVPV